MMIAHKRLSYADCDSSEDGEVDFISHQPLIAFTNEQNLSPRRRSSLSAIIVKGVLNGFYSSDD